MEDNTKISIQKDGDQWCVLWGGNLQTGIVAFGDTPEEAIKTFARKIIKPIIICQNCGEIDPENQEVYCDDCFEESKSKISDLEDEIYNLKNKIEELENK